MAGTGARGRVFFDGMLTRPRLDHPEGVAVHPDGSVWCGGEQGQIYRIAPDGSRLEVVASTDGFALGLAFSHTGELYACDVAYRAVFRIDIGTGVIARFTDGGAARPFVTPNYPVVAVDGTIYVSDSFVQ